MLNTLKIMYVAAGGKIFRIRPGLTNGLQRGVLWWLLVWHTIDGVPE